MSNETKAAGPIQAPPPSLDGPTLISPNAKELDRMRIATYGKTFNEKLAEGLIDKDGNSLVNEPDANATSEPRRIPPGRKHAPLFISYSREELDRMRIETYGKTANEIAAEGLIDEASGFKRLQPSPDRAKRPRLTTFSAETLDQMRIETYGKTANEIAAEELERKLNADIR